MALSDSDVRATYPDLLRGDDEPDTLHVVRLLDAGYGQVRAPLALRDAIPRGVPGGRWLTASAPPSRHRVFGRLVPPLVAAAVCASLVLLNLVTMAAPSITDLGKPTNNVPLPPNRPLANFRRAGPYFRHGGKPEVLFLGTMVEDYSAIQRWALVKALDQFGSFSGVNTAETRSCNMNIAPIKVRCFPSGDQYGYPVGSATYNFEGARYSSRYIALVATDLIDVNTQVNHRLPPVDTQLFDRYLKNTTGMQQFTLPSDDALWKTALNDVESTRGFPLISIGGYLGTSAGTAIPGDLQSPNGALLRFNVIQQSLQQGRAVGSQRTTEASPSLAPDVNAEVNVITALICHADHRKPRSVCGRSVIKHLLTHVK